MPADCVQPTLGLLLIAPMKKIIALILVLCIVSSVQASMIWKAFEVGPSEVSQLPHEPAKLKALVFSDKTDGVVNLDKAWHGIHFLLTGTAWTSKPGAGQAVLGGREFGPDLGYGPARLLNPAEVKAIARALEGQSPDSLASRFDVSAMEREDIYPTIWQREGREALQYLLHYYAALRSFYSKAAANGSGVVIVLV
jgi:hypothetical protein